MDSYNFQSKDVDWESINAILSGIDWQNLLAPLTVDNALSQLHQQILSAVETNAPLRNTKRPNKSRAKREKYNLTRRRRRINNMSLLHQENNHCTKS